MIDRIKLLLETQGMTATEFADKVGIQRSGLSHIMSGRNKASLDFVRKVLAAFPEISPDWLIQGKGSLLRKDGGPRAGKQQDMFSSDQGIIRSEDPVEYISQSQLQSEKNKEEDVPHGHSQKVDSSQRIEKEQEKENDQGKDKIYGAAQNNQSNVKNDGNEVVQIAILYADGSFKMYNPK